jgi:hypothetical protein
VGVGIYKDSLKFGKLGNLSLIRYRINRGLSLMQTLNKNLWKNNFELRIKKNIQLGAVGLFSIFGTKTTPLRGKVNSILKFRVIKKNF